MPYIEPDRRDAFEPALSTLAAEIETEGELNYVFTVLAARCAAGVEEYGYAPLNAIHGVFHAAANEFYRRVVVPYEERKLEENGDVI